MTMSKAGTMGIAVAWVLGLALGAALVAAAGEPSVPADPWVAKVNGEPISARLFEWRLLRNRSAAYRYFAQKYGVSDSAEFWTTSYDGETPLEWTKRRALDECVRIALQQTLAHDHGVIADISYPAFLRTLEAENERRRAAVAHGEPIYGPQQYGEDEYFNYLLANTVIELKRRLWEGELHASDDVLRQHYEREKDKLYSRGDRVTALVAGMRFGGSAAGATREAARSDVEALSQKLASSQTLDEVRAVAGPSTTVEEIVFDDQSARSDDRVRPVARSEAMKLSPGQVSPVYEERSGFWAMKCVSRESLGYRPFEEVRDNVRSRYVDEQYEALIAGLVSRASTEINRDAYDAVRVR